MRLFAPFPAAPWPLVITLGLLTLSPAAQNEKTEKPEVRAPVVITYGAEGLRLTSALVEAVLNGSVSRRLRASGHEHNPDWPPRRMAVDQSPEDQQQPAGYFSFQLVIPGQSSGEQTDQLLRGAVEALAEELNARLYETPKQRLEERLTPARAQFEESGHKLAELESQVASVGDSASAVEDQLHELRAQFQERELAQQVDDPLVAVEQKQTAEIEQRLSRLLKERQSRETEAVDVETKLESVSSRFNENVSDSLRAQVSTLRNQLSNLHAVRDQFSREFDTLSQRQASLASSVQERVQRLQESRVRADQLRRQIDLTEQRLREVRSTGEERAALERQVAALEATRDRLRPRIEDLQRELDGLTPVRVDLWR